MESQNFYELVGGIAAVVLYPTSAPLPAEPTTDLSAIECDHFAVSMAVGEASYTEKMECMGGAMNFTVRHTLKFQCSHDDAPLDEYCLAKVRNEGVVADIRLGTGLTIRVGWSARYGVQYPLRLTSTTFESGSKPLDYPLRSWVLESVDQSLLI